jgi:hypothetical protein
LAPELLAHWQKKAKKTVTWKVHGILGSRKVCGERQYRVDWGNNCHWWLPERELKRDEVLAKKIRDFHSME